MLLYTNRNRQIRILQPRKHELCIPNQNGKIAAYLTSYPSNFRDKNIVKLLFNDFETHKI